MATAVTAIGGATPAHALSITVNSTLDEHDATPGDGACRSTPSNVCTLRAAIEESNTFTGGDTIAIPAGTYTLSLGELRVTGMVVLNGSGRDSTIVQAATQRGVAFGRVFHLQPTGSDRVTVNALTIRHGRVRAPDFAFGGGALTSGLVTMRNVAVVNNMADEDGGGIWNRGRLEIVDSIVSGNEAGKSGGGVGCTVGEGSDPESQDRLVIRNTLIASNFAGTGGGFGGGGGLQANDCNVTADRSTFTDNQAPDNGGGVWLDEKGTHAFTNVTISRNTSQRHSGGVSFTGQEASGGGAQSTLLLSHATVVGNRTARAGAGANLISSVQERVSVRNSIIANPLGTTQNCSSGSFSNSTAQITTLGGNVQFPGSTCFSTSPPSGTADFSNVDPQVLALANNGGPTPTHALASTSRAIDHPRASTCLSVDQRGLPRPRDGNGDGIARCDSGAFEVQSGSTGLFSLSPTDAAAGVGDRLTYEFTWTVPAPGNWHDLNGLDFRLRDAGGVAFWVHWDEAANTFSLVDPATEEIGPPFAPGSAATLVGGTASLLLSETSVQGSGPTGPSVTLRLRLAITEAAVGRTFTVEVLGADDQGTVQGFEPAGTLRVAGVALNDPNNQDRDDEDDTPRETEEQRQQRQRTNNGHRGDVTTEGNVVAVERPDGVAYVLVTVAQTRNEVLVVQVFCPADRCPDIRQGDYLEADGYQNGVGDANAWFVAADGVEITRNGKRVK